ncbi:DUF427 domain-containing protein [Gordonia sp. SID5947]|uniref:DUF427 domain-containing protein n=1 Tax=Gordonia sp. SID5947 TaxID=2690315 RepID=UPI00136D9778|nr:DUF427 domain-containing protein [Gordonia sp. SID5947]MYR08438.1 DUF427 domain-containing protein [Gordonia sp. SID5947]
MARGKLEPGPDHPITVSPTGGRVVVKVGDAVVARTSDAFTLREAEYPPVQYIPRECVDPSLLRDSTTTTFCPYKGECNYYDLTLESEVLTDAVWIYRSPYDAVAEIADHVAFYPGRVSVDVDVASG